MALIPDSFELILYFEISRIFYEIKMADTNLTTEESLSTSTTVTVSSADISSNDSVSFQKPSRSAVWKHFFVATNRAHGTCCARRFFHTMVGQLLI